MLNIRNSILCILLTALWAKSSEAGLKQDMFIVNKMTAGWRHWKDLPEEFKQYCVAEFKAKLEAEKLDFVTGDKNELANLALQALSLTSQNAFDDLEDLLDKNGKSYKDLCKIFDNGKFLEFLAFWEIFSAKNPEATGYKPENVTQESLREILSKYSQKMKENDRK